MGIRKIRSIVIGSGLLVLSAKLAVDSVGDFRQWHRLAEERDAQADARVTDVWTKIDSDSGRSRGYEVAYEFAAAGESLITGRQEMSTEDYNDISAQEITGGPVTVRYDADDPSNSAIASADEPPSTSVLFVPLALAIPGAWRLWAGLRMPS